MSNPMKDRLYDILAMHEKGLSVAQIARKLRLKRNVIEQAIKEWA